MKPWERQPKETEPAYRAFSTYRDMGEERTIDLVGQKLGKSGSLISLWSAKWDWVERCRAWDNNLQSAKDRVSIKYAEKWEQRRQTMLEQNWSASQLLRRRVEELLQFPIQTETREYTEDGTTIIATIEPARWNYMSLAQIMKLAAEIQMSTIHEALPRVDDDGFDPSTATTEELEKAAGRQGKSRA